MIYFSRHYNEAGAVMQLQAVLTDILQDAQKPPVILCIGSDRHVLDCFGPLTGSILNASGMAIPVYGDLDHPLHAANLPRELRLIQQAHENRFEIAIDASLGIEEEIGTVKVREGAVLPARAVGKRLPAVGNLAITGVVGVRQNSRNLRPVAYGSLSHVYHMASLVSKAFLQWDKSRGTAPWG